MRTRHLPAVVGLLAVVAGAASCDDSVYQSSTGSPRVPRLSATLNVNGAGSTLYTARILVNAPDRATEYIQIAAIDGSRVSFSGSAGSPLFCVRAGEEYAFLVTADQGAPSLHVALGRISSSHDAAVALGADSPCAPADGFEVEESIVLTLPAAVSPGSADAQADADDSSSDARPESGDAGGDGEATESGTDATAEGGG